MTTGLERFSTMMAAAPTVLPSLLKCDFGNLEREVERLEEAGVAGLHLDVMDGVFVPNFTYGITIVAALRKLTDLPLDVHLMMVNPDNYIDQFCDAGADVLTIHAEACDHLPDAIQQIKKASSRRGRSHQSADTGFGDCRSVAVSGFGIGDERQRRVWRAKFHRSSS